VSRAPILNGQAVVAGAWPSVGWLDVGCSAVLVHPEVILYAGHCGTEVERVWFGDSFNVQADEVERVLHVNHSPTERSVRVTRCEEFPGAEFGLGNDLAFCLLGEVVKDIPAPPPAVGCEGAGIKVGTDATLIGFGFERFEEGGLGIKRISTLPIAGLDREISIGNAMAGTCAGDSGGPAYIRVPSDGDGEEWRLLGILSSGLKNECGVGFYSNAGQFLEWLESRTRRRIAPCFDSDGSWRPQAACSVPAIDSDGLPISVQSFSATCGKPYVHASDHRGPTVVAAWNSWNAESGIATLGVSAMDDQTGISRVEVQATGPSAGVVWQSATEVEPYIFDDVPLNRTTIVSVSAEDGEGNRTTVTLRPPPARGSRDSRGACDFSPRASIHAMNSGIIALVLGWLRKVRRWRALRATTERSVARTLLLLVIILCTGACGRSARRSNDGTTPGDGASGGNTDGEPSTKTLCPDEEPSPASGCEEGMICTYGVSPRRDCKTTFSCEDLQWRRTKGECRQPPAGYCPDENPSGQRCTAVNEVGAVVQRGPGAPCEYEQSVCLCYGCSSRACQNGQSTWECSKRPEDTTNCPGAPPNLGTGCNGDQLECTYGDPCTSSGQTVMCRLGRWEEVGALCPE